MSAGEEVENQEGPRTAADAWLSNDEPEERMSAGEDAKEYAESGSTTSVQDLPLSDKMVVPVCRRSKISKETILPVVKSTGGVKKLSKENSFFN